MKNIQTITRDFFIPCITHVKCWQCTHFRKSGGRGVNGCRLDPHSLDNGWNYFPATYRAKDYACYDFELKSEIIEHLKKLNNRTLDFFNREYKSLEA